MQPQQTLVQLLGLVPAELEAFCADIGEPAYRARQIFRWLYNKQVTSFDAMTDLSQSLRTKLGQHALLAPLSLQTVQHSEDGTKKFLFTLHDGREVESVLIPSEMRNESGDNKRMTICVSTQVGCPLGCKFCATASLKMKRNLTTGEILGQLLLVQQHAEQKITNLVFMGMGEPMLNYDNVMKAVDIMIHSEADLLSPRRITLSTSGIVEGIKRMADEDRPIKLALSLHALTDGLRTNLMPINKKWNLRALGDAIEYYYRKTRRTVTYEYILFEGLNDTYQDAVRMAKMTRRVPSKVNVIPFHTIEFTNPEGISAQLRPTEQATFEQFIQWLKSLDVTVMVRTSSGKDIHAACGQLALSHGKATSLPVTAALRNPIN